MSKKRVLLACISVLVFLLIILGVIIYVFFLIKEYHNKKYEENLPLRIEKHLEENSIQLNENSERFYTIPLGFVEEEI